jgi:hypothetical protein
MVTHSRLDWNRSISWVPAIAATVNTAISRSHSARLFAWGTFETVLFVVFMMISEMHAGRQAYNVDSRANTHGCRQKDGTCCLASRT